MHRLLRTSYVLFGFVVLGALAACTHSAKPIARPLVKKIPLGMHVWTFQGSLTLASRQETPRGSGVFTENRSTARVWFEPFVGFRLEIEPAAGQRGQHMLYGTDGMTIWAYDPVANR